jgi:hypothetical protein
VRIQKGCEAERVFVRRTGGASFTAEHQRSVVLDGKPRAAADTSSGFCYYSKSMKLYLRIPEVFYG